MKIWVVGRYLGSKRGGDAWQIVGVYDTEERALRNCIEPTHWIAPANLNERIFDKCAVWNGLYYPKLSREAG